MKISMLLHRIQQHSELKNCSQHSENYSFGLLGSRNERECIVNTIISGVEGRKRVWKFPRKTLEKDINSRVVGAGGQAPCAEHDQQNV